MLRSVGLSFARKVLSPSQSLPGAAAVLRQRAAAHDVFGASIRPALAVETVRGLTTQADATHSGTRRDGKRSWPRPGHPYGWIDAEAESLIAKAYKRHRVLSQQGRSYPPSLTDGDLEKLSKPTHRAPEDFVDKVAFRFMRFLRRFVHAFFREKYDHHAVTLETVAAVPGMVAAFHRHMRSLRRMKRDHGWIGHLLEESENERMHLLIWLKVTQPTRLERMVVVAAQGIYILFYSAMYALSGRACHRLTGYLEEEAFAAYTDYLKALDNGSIPLRPAPDIAIEYYRLPPNATTRDVVLHVRADEAAHREFNHHLGDKYHASDIDSAPAMMKDE